MRPIFITARNFPRPFVEEELGLHYSIKLRGKVWSLYDEDRRAYVIRGEGLPAHPDMAAQYPRGWSMLDYVKPVDAQAIARAAYRAYQAEHWGAHCPVPMEEADDGPVVIL